MILLIIASSFWVYWAQNKALNNINNKKEMPIAAGVFLIPFILITTCCLVALVKIRSFLKETGMGDRVDTCKILLHSTIFILFTLQMIGKYVFVDLGNYKLAFSFVFIFLASAHVADCAILWILWCLGTHAKRNSKHYESATFSNESTCNATD
jgi:hypothetical protein